MHACSHAMNTRFTQNGSLGTRLHLYTCINSPVQATHVYVPRFLAIYAILLRFLSMAKLRERAQFRNCVPPTQFGNRINYVFNAF